jgi:hypothetical protein
MNDLATKATAAQRERAVQPTIGGSIYIKPQEMAWEPTQFVGISIKVLHEDKEKGEMTCLLKWEPGATLPMHKHPEIEQTYVIEGSFSDHDGICRAGEFVCGGLARSMRPTPTKAPLSSPSTASRTFSSIAPDILAGAAEGGQRRLAQLVAEAAITPVSDPTARWSGAVARWPTSHRLWES